MQTYDITGAIHHPRVIAKVLEVMILSAHSSIHPPVLFESVSVSLCVCGCVCFCRRMNVFECLNVTGCLCLTVCVYFCLSVSWCVFLFQ